MQHAASTTKSLPGRDKCRTDKLHKAHLSLAAKEGLGVQKSLLRDGTGHNELNHSCNSTQGATQASAALCLVFCFNNQNQLGCLLVDVLKFVFISHVCDDAPYHALVD